MSDKMPRKVLRIASAQKVKEGEGVLVYRSFPSPTLLDFDPFLLLDEMGPEETKPDQAKGVPHHPHRGLEMLTYMLAGTLHHQDSLGHRTNLSPGDVQWMTAGSGLIHSEMPEESFLKKGGLFHGIQLWVNLPKSVKMMRPSYREIKAKHIPQEISENGQVIINVIAGQALKETGLVNTYTPILYFHAKLMPGATWVQPVADNFNVIAYILKGKGMFFKKAKEKIQLGEPHQMIMFDNKGDTIEIECPKAAMEPLELLLLGGIPIHEPVVRYGPFVMNTEEEIRQAFIDYHTGKMGHLI